MTSDSICPACGRPLDTHDQHFRFTLPDPVLDTAAGESAPGTWMSHGDARSSVMMQVPSVGPFVRALLPVSLFGGFTITFGVWLLVHPDDFQRAYRIWWEPEYADLVLDGWLANALPGWGLLATPVRAVVRDPEETPYCSESPDQRLNAVLSQRWPHDVVLDAIHPR
jgi:hypothetical protein